MISDAPALVLSGEVDPVTPPVWGESVVKHLSHGKHLIVPSTGHGVVMTPRESHRQRLHQTRIGGRPRNRLRRRRPPSSLLPHTRRARSVGGRQHRQMIQIANARKQFARQQPSDGVSFVAQDGATTGPRPERRGEDHDTPDALRRDETRQRRGACGRCGCGGDAAGGASRLGVLPDGFGLYPRLTAREHLDYFGAAGIESDRLAQRTEELLDLLDMRAIADRRTAGFSHGERTKVALARALVHDPQNVLLDEPTNGLDVMSTRAVRSIVRRLRDQGRCVLFSSHVMQEVSALCDSIVVIAAGRVVAHGTPDELRQHTGHQNLEDAFVALAGLDRGAHE